MKNRAAQQLERNIMNEAKTTEAGINEAIARRVKDIRQLVSLGWSYDAAIANVRSSSTLGVKSWEAVTAEIRRLRRRDYIARIGQHRIEVLERSNDGFTAIIR